MTIITYEGRMGSGMSMASVLMFSEFSKRNKERIYTRYINPSSYSRSVQFLEYVDFKTSKGILDPDLEYLFPFCGHPTLDRVFHEFIEQSRNRQPKKPLECDIYLNGRKLKPFEE